MGVSWVDGESDTYVAPGVERREPLSRLPPLRTDLSLRFSPDVASRAWAEAVATLADGQDRLSSRDEADTDRIPPGGTPGYAVFTLRGGLHVTENLWISAAVENLLDADYRLHGSGVNEPGRNLVLSAGLVF
jgi:hemoglobin/transferrin/lactoferrin receptor protein